MATRGSAARSSLPVKVGSDRVLLGREPKGRPSIGHTCVRKRLVGADAAIWGMLLTLGTTSGGMLLGRECEARPYVVCSGTTSVPRRPCVRVKLRQVLRSWVLAVKAGDSGTGPRSEMTSPDDLTHPCIPKYLVGCYTPSQRRNKKRSSLSQKTMQPEPMKDSRMMIRQECCFQQGVFPNNTLRQ